MSRFQCFIFLKGEQGTTKNGKSQLLRVARSGYTVILIKPNKGLKLVPSLLHRPNNMLEMFLIQYTCI